MPLDSKGKYQLNDQKVRHADKQAQAPAAPPVADAAMGAAADAPVPFATVYDNGDGTGYTETGDGQRIEHPDMESTKALLMSDSDQSMGDDAMAPAQEGDWA